MVLGLHIITQQRGRLVEIDDKKVEVAVVVEIAKRAAAAAMCGAYTSACLCQYFLKPAVTQIAKQHSRSPVRIFRKLLLDFRVYAAGDPEQVGKTVVVQIENCRSPVDVTGFHAE